MTTAADSQIVPREAASLPELRAADRGVAEALTAVLSDNTQRVYGAQWRLFTGWCDEVGLTFLPTEPLTVARYLAARTNTGAVVATLRLATSAISKAYEWAGHESLCKDQGVRASLTLIKMGTAPRQTPAPVRRPHRHTTLHMNVL